jgi:phage-related protein
VSALRLKIRYQVLPLPLVQREAKKLLTQRQLVEGIAIAKQLRYYPTVPQLSIEPCGEAMELRLESKSLNQQGWLRAMFYVDDRSRTIYIVNLFWKKTNKVSVADLHRVNHRIRQLKSMLSAGAHPWKSGE